MTAICTTTLSVLTRDVSVTPNQLIANVTTTSITIHTA
jgi:hypothetical protein